MIQQFSPTKKECSFVSLFSLMVLVLASVVHVSFCESRRLFTPSFIGSSVIQSNTFRNKLIWNTFPVQMHLNQQTNNNKDIEIDLMNYDFASKQGWEDFYQQTTTTMVEEREVATTKSSSSELSSLNPFQFEWHASIDPSTIISSLIFPTTKLNDTNNNKILLVGNGNSDLPKLIHEHFDGRMNINIACLDYSQICIDMLRIIYNDKETYHNMDFICGDATNLESCIQNYYHINSDNEDGAMSFDYIVDKGLLDAMMCNEGWNSSLEKYFKGVSGLLRNGEGKIILVSYNLSTSTKEFLSEIGDKYGIHWEFHIEEKSNDRVSFSIGSKV